MDVVKAIGFIIATLTMICCLVFVPDSATAVALSYIGVLGVYLGLDVAEMISATARLKAGQYKKIKYHKYIVSGACLAACIIACGLNWTAALNATMTTLLSAVMVLAGCAIGGLEGNKIATQIDGEKDGSE